MRTAEAIVADLRELGRSDEQIRVVGFSTHGGKFNERIIELLGMDPNEVDKLAATGRRVKANCCPECGCQMKRGACPEAANHTERA